MMRPRTRNPASIDAPSTAPSLDSDAAPMKFGRASYPSGGSGRADAPARTMRARFAGFDATPRDGCQRAIGFRGARANGALLTETFGCGAEAFEVGDGRATRGSDRTARVDSSGLLRAARTSLPLPLAASAFAARLRSRRAFVAGRWAVGTSAFGAGAVTGSTARARAIATCTAGACASATFAFAAFEVGTCAEGARAAATYAAKTCGATACLMGTCAFAACAAGTCAAESRPERTCASPALTDRVVVPIEIRCGSKAMPVLTVSPIVAGDCDAPVVLSGTIAIGRTIAKYPAASKAIPAALAPATLARSIKREVRALASASSVTHETVPRSARSGRLASSEVAGPKR